MEREIWVKIRAMKASGLGIRAIARDLKLSRNTVRSALTKDSHLPKKRNRAALVLLEPFKAEILRMKRQNFIGTRIFHELRKLGYTGGQTQLYKFLSQLNQLEPSLKVTERYETAAGEQAQFDWSYYTVVFAGISKKVVVFCLILAFSRRKFYWASSNDTQSSTFEALEKGFWHFGGVTKELLVDNAKVLVQISNPANFSWNSKFLEFCGYYRIKPVACKIRRPQTKGKVERPFFYLENHFIKGRTFKDFEDFCWELSSFSLQLDILTHPTTGFRPLDRFQEEEPHLTALPVKPFLGNFFLIRKVSWDCLISFAAVRYSVPYQFAGKLVWARISQGELLEIFDSNGELIASHKISGSGATVIDKSHYEGLKKQPPRTIPALKEAFLKEFPAEEDFLLKLLAHYKFHPERHIREILQFSPFYPKAKILEAFALALKYNNFSHTWLRQVLQNPEEVQSENVALPLLTLSGIPKLKINRELKIYQTLLEKEN